MVWLKLNIYSDSEFYKKQTIILKSAPDKQHILMFFNYLYSLLWRLFIIAAWMYLKSNLFLDQISSMISFFRTWFVYFVFICRLMDFVWFILINRLCSIESNLWNLPANYKNIGNTWKKGYTFQIFPKITAKCKNNLHDEIPFALSRKILSGVASFSFNLQSCVRR